MIESGQISEKDPVQNTVAKCTQGYNKKIIRGTSTRTKLRKITEDYAQTRSKEIDRAIVNKELKRTSKKVTPQSASKYEK